MNNNLALLDAAGALPPANINEILRHIPHRFPFLLVDRVNACEPGKWVRATKLIARDEPLLQHCGGQAYMPELLIVEALAQASGVLCHYSGMTSLVGKTIIFFAGVEKCEIHQAARPGDMLTLICQMRRSMRGVAKIVGTASLGNKLVISADLTAVVRDQ